jgi:hypothetical protein
MARSILFSGRQEGAKLDSIDIDRYTAVGTAGIEIQTEVIGVGPDDHCVAIPDLLFNDNPGSLTNAARVVSDIHAGTHLQEEPGKIST